MQLPGVAADPGRLLEELGIAVLVGRGLVGVEEREVRLRVARSRLDRREERSDGLDPVLPVEGLGPLPEQGVGRGFSALLAHGPFVTLAAEWFESRAEISSLSTDP